VVDGKYFTAPLPQYEQYDISQVVSVREDPDHPVYGDSKPSRPPENQSTTDIRPDSHDDGPSINAILRKNANCKIVFFPQGIYRTNTTIYVPPGSRLVGEVFSVITGAGPFFTDPSNPQPILKVGNPGERGTAQLTDLLISVSSILPGAILLRINLAGDPSSSPAGSVGLWNCVLRVGGSADSLVTTSCGDRDPSSCKAAFALLHLTPSSSAYLEDVWGWVADHSLDNPSADPPQNIAVGRGALIESKSPTWLVGTSFEHCTLYQYALRGAEILYIGQHQSENPYWQGKGAARLAPEPWAVNASWGDPDFKNCEEGDYACRRAWGLYVNQTRDAVIHGSAMWSFFNAMDDNLWSDPQCMLTDGVCQTNMAYVEGARGMWWFSVSSKSTENLVVDVGGGDGTGASGNGSVIVTTQRDNPGSWGAVVAAYLRNTGLDEGDGEIEGKDSGGGMVVLSGLTLAAVVVGILHQLLLAV
jgi:glucan 1,3-beta-glucosidase